MRICACYGTANHNNKGEIMCKQEQDKTMTDLTELLSQMEYVKRQYSFEFVIKPPTKISSDEYWFSLSLILNNGESLDYDASSIDMAIGFLDGYEAYHLFYIKQEKKD